MSWSKVKTCLIILFLIVNIFFIYNISRQYYYEYVLNPQVAQDTANILKSSGIHIDQAQIPSRKLNCKIFEGGVDMQTEAYYMNTVMGLTGDFSTENYTLHMINNGIKIISDADGDQFEFYNDSLFSFQYLKGSEKNDAENYLDFIKFYFSDEISDANFSLQDNEKAGTNFVKLDEASDKTTDSIKKTIEDFLFSKKKSSINTENFFGNEMSISVRDVYSGTKNGNAIYIVKFNQSQSNLDIYGCEAFCVVKNNTVVYMSGKIIFCEPTASYTRDLYDCINILFMEKADIEKKQTQDILPQDSKSDESISASDKKDIPAVTVTEIKNVYIIYWNATRTKYYLIPAWNIEYDGEIVHVRNAVNGKIYTF